MAETEIQLGMSEAPFSFSLRKGEAMFTIRAETFDGLCAKLFEVEDKIAADPRVAEVFGPFGSRTSESAPSSSDSPSAGSGLAAAIGQTATDIPNTGQSRPVAAPAGKFDFS